MSRKHVLEARRTYARHVAAFYRLSPRCVTRTVISPTEFARRTFYTAVELKEAKRKTGEKIREIMLFRARVCNRDNDERTRRVSQ